MSSTKETITNGFRKAGIEINGNRPWDIQVRNEQFYNIVAKQGKFGLGEAYLDGLWDAQSIDELNNKMLLADYPKYKINLPLIWSLIRAALVNMQSPVGSKKVVEQHYDLSADLYMSFLDPYNQYTCGYFKDTDDLNVAQEKKLELICQKLQIKPTDKVLDIGCGWGGFAKYAAEHYGCSVTGISISDEQIKYAQEYTKGLPVKIVKKDYRELDEKFDKILICGMIEHVGYKNYRTMFEIVNRNLNDNGLFLLHTIGTNRSAIIIEPWLNKYIFPNSMLPSLSQLVKAMRGLFVMEDWHNFSAYYDPTLMAWYKNFENNWPKIKANYDERFFRMWKYYLLCCAGVFRARQAQLWQIVMSKKGVIGGYQSVR